MSEFTTEKLNEIAETDHVQCGDASALARELLALRERAEPVAWTDEQELRDVNELGCGYLFTVNPITPHADPRRVIKLYAEPPAPPAPPAPVVPEGLRIALSNAGIAAPESDEMLWASQQDYIQMLVTWVKDRKPFKPASVLPVDVLAALRNVAKIRLDFNDFDGDRRGMADCLGEAEEALIEVVNRRAAMIAAPGKEG
ncbi:hypothetical protein [Cronobacter malonaticus]|uniref:hypothetical protein n=1 Tax=Cronobacter malonaticus TaxID=413503 RepID=UPI00067B8C40|nr:hypothetical protein [Cronobacter malonaticus]